MSDLETPRLTEGRLAAIKARAEAATAGPWMREPNWCRVWVGPSGPCLFSAPYAAPEKAGGKTEGTPEDFEFIAHARTDVPALCKEVEKLQADLQTALNALADIANLTKGEVGDGTAQRKAKRIYNFIRDRNPDDPVD